MSPLKTIACLVVLLFVFACGEDGKQRADQGETIQSFPLPLFNKLLAECDYVDIIFYNSPASISQEDKGSIRSALMFMDPIPFQPKEECKSIGRIAYMINGEIVAEGDIHASPGCEYIAFLEEGKVVYSNKLSENGVNFFSGILKQIEQANQ